MRWNLMKQDKDVVRLWMKLVQKVNEDGDLDLGKLLFHQANINNNNKKSDSWKKLIDTSMKNPHCFQSNLVSFTINYLW